MLKTNERMIPAFQVSRYPRKKEQYRLVGALSKCQSSDQDRHRHPSTGFAWSFWVSILKCGSGPRGEQGVRTWASSQPAMPQSHAASQTEGSREAEGRGRQQGHRVSGAQGWWGNTDGLLPDAKALTSVEQGGKPEKMHPHQEQPITSRSWSLTQRLREQTPGATPGEGQAGSLSTFFTGLLASLESQGPSKQSWAIEVGYMD